MLLQVLEGLIARAYPELRVLKLSGDEKVPDRARVEDYHSLSLQKDYSYLLKTTN